jgi:hypothetical protein
VDTTAIEAALSDKSWGADIRFLDTINSKEELVEVREHFIADHRNTLRSDTFDFYEEWLGRWPNPELTSEFRGEFPNVSAILDTPQKVRVFLRGADFRKVKPPVMASVFEDIFRRRKNPGCEKRVVYARYRGTQWFDALRIVYHTQLQAWTLTDLMLPGCQSKGIHSDEGLVLDWRTRSEREAAGERW